MPIKQAAKKALRQTVKRTVVNDATKDNIKELAKKLAKEIAAKKKKEAVASFTKLTQALDKAVKNNILVKNTAARQKSKFQKQINKIN